MCKKKEDWYPGWTCQECAIAAGVSVMPHAATFQVQRCPVCLQIKSVTEPRDYGYPEWSEALLKKLRSHEPDGEMIRVKCKYCGFDGDIEQWKEKPVPGAAVVECICPECGASEFI